MKFVTILAAILAMDLLLHLTVSTNPWPPIGDLLVLWVGMIVPATILLSMGVNPKQVQELLGHSQINMTIGKYGHVLPSMQKEIAEKFNDLLS